MKYKSYSPQMVQPMICFGCSVSLDGDTALIGAYMMMIMEFILDQRTYSPDIGTTWTQQAKLRLPQTAQQWTGLVVLFLLMETPPSSEHIRMIDNQILGRHTCSPAPAPLGHNRPNCSPQTER